MHLHERKIVLPKDAQRPPGAYSSDDLVVVSARVTLEALRVGAHLGT